MTNKHEQHKKTDINNGRTTKNQPIFQDFKRTTKPEEEEEEQHQHFSAFHPILKKVGKINSTNF